MTNFLIRRPVILPGSSDEWKNYLVKTDADGNVQWSGLYPVASAGGNNAAEHINLTRGRGISIEISVL